MARTKECKDVEKNEVNKIEVEKKDIEKNEVNKTEETFEVTVTPDVAFNLRLQEFDKAIALSEQRTAEIKAQKASFIYDSNLQTVTEQHKAELIRKQIEEETIKRAKK